MFDRFVRLAQAQKALRRSQFDAAIGLLDDPAIRRHRRTEDLRRRALTGLVARGARRLAEGEIGAAQLDCDLALKHDPENLGAIELSREISALKTQGKSDRQTSSELCRRGRAAIERGALGVAQDLLDQAGVENGEVGTLRRLIVARRDAATLALQRARTAMKSNDAAAARAELSSACALDDALQGAAELRTQVDAAAAHALLRRVESADDAGQALRWIAAERASCPDILVSDKKLRALAHELSRTAAEPMRRALSEGDLEAAAAQLRQFAKEERALLQTAMGIGLDTLESVAKQVAQGDAVAGAALRGLADQIGSRDLARFAQRFESQCVADRKRIDKARKAAASGGDLGAARALLREVLTATPEHCDAVRALRALDTSEAERRERLSRARAVADSGRLIEAIQLLRADAVPGSAGREAQECIDDLRMRVDSVQRGLEQIQRDAHGRSSGTRRGLEHCIARAEELLAVQSDADELAALADAMRAEVKGLDLLDVATEAFDARAFPRLAEALADFEDLRPSFLATDRLDARVEALCDRAVQATERDLEAGRLSLVERSLEVFQRPVFAAGVRRRFDALDEQRQQRAATAETAVECGLAAIERRDLEAAEVALDEARVAWIDGPVVTRLERALGGLRDNETSLESAEALVGRDAGAARAHLEDLGPTPGMFRTRIYDLKKGLARAQGLDHGFLLRVDEGGEWLVLRGESLTIGNCRDGGADIPILAHLAGRHARIRRTLSFHGGLEDKIEPESGEVYIDERPIERAARLRDGSEIRLGRSMQLSYRQPSRRSLTSALTLRGHAVAGTDKLLLMKDRGRDGRILIGPGRDVHVQVPNAEAEIEVFASKDGQIRVRCAGRGTIDSKPFTGEEPVIAGAVISAAGVTFVAQPWVKGV